MKAQTDTREQLFCLTHKVPYEGVCDDENCGAPGLVCKECLKEKNIKLSEHNVKNFDYFYKQRFRKVLNTFELKELKKSIELSKTIDKANISARFQNFQAWEQKTIEEKVQKFHDSIKLKLFYFIRKIKEEHRKINEQNKEANCNTTLSIFEIPECLSLEEVKNILDKKESDFGNLKHLISLIKKYSDNEKITKNQKELEAVIYSKSLYDTLSRVSLENQKKSINNLLRPTSKLILSTIFPPKKPCLAVCLKEKKFTSDPKKLVFIKNLTTRAQKSYTIDSVFAVYTGADSQAYLAASVGNDIEIIGISKDGLIKTLKGHTSHIFIVRHFYNKKKEVNNLISTANERSVKVWDADNYLCVFTIPSCHTGLYLYSALLLFDEFSGKDYVVTSCPNEYLKLWDYSTGKFVREIGSSSDYTYFLNIWSHKGEYYIINANTINVKIYGIKRQRELFKEYKSSTITWHMSAFAKKIKDVEYLFETDANGNLRMWNILTGVLFKTIHVEGCILRGICYWNEEYVIAASSDKGFKVINFENFLYPMSFYGHDNIVCSVAKIKSPPYGECLVTAGIDGKIKLWATEGMK